METTRPCKQCGTPVPIQTRLVNSNNPLQTAAWGERMTRIDVTPRYCSACQGAGCLPLLTLTVALACIRPLFVLVAARSRG